MYNKKKKIYILPKVSHDYYGKKKNNNKKKLCMHVHWSQDHLKRGSKLKKTSPNTWDFQPFFSGLLLRQSANIYTSLQSKICLCNR